MAPRPIANIVTIDILPLFGINDNNTNLESKIQVAKQIDEACRTTGCFLISNHGIQTLRELVQRTQQFYTALTNEEKRALTPSGIYIKGSGKQKGVGYYPPKEGKRAAESYVFTNPSFNETHPMVKAKVPSHEVNIWPNPSSIIGFQSFIEDYYWSVFNLSQILLKGFALALGQEETFFGQYFTKEGSLSSMRLMHYPFQGNWSSAFTTKAPDGTKLNFGSHVDVSLLTIIYQPSVAANFQLETPQGYRDVPSSEDCLLIHVGGYMEHVTNHYYKAPVHRVKFEEIESLSLPFFVHLDYEAKIEPLTKLNYRDENENLKETCHAMPYGEYLEKARLDKRNKNFNLN